MKSQSTCSNPKYNKKHAHRIFLPLSSIRIPDKTSSRLYTIFLFEVSDPKIAKASSRAGMICKETKYFVDIIN